MKRYSKELTAEELAKLPDSAIDYSDISELDDAFWEEAEVVVPPGKEHISIKVDRDVLAYFRSAGRGYQTRMNAVLRSFMEAKRKQADQ